MAPFLRQETSTTLPQDKCLSVYLLLAQIFFATADDQNKLHTKILNTEENQVSRMWSRLSPLDTFTINTPNCNKVVIEKSKKLNRN